MELTADSNLKLNHVADHDAGKSKQGGKTNQINADARRQAAKKRRARSTRYAHGRRKTMAKAVVTVGTDKTYKTHICDLEIGQSAPESSTHPYSTMQSPTKQAKSSVIRHTCTSTEILLWAVLSLCVVFPISAMLVYVAVCSTVSADVDGVSQCFFWNGYSANGQNATFTGNADANNVSNVTV
jgi:hypothetical protein